MGSLKSASPTIPSAPQPSPVTLSSCTGSKVHGAVPTMPLPSLSGCARGGSEGVHSPRPQTGQYDSKEKMMEHRGWAFLWLFLLYSCHSLSLTFSIRDNDILP